MQPLRLFKLMRYHSNNCTRNRYRLAQQFVLGSVCVFLFSCGPKSTDGSKTIERGDALVEWFSIADAGLLSAEMSGDSLAFTLLVGAGESCTGEVAGVAVKQDDDTYKYGDADCGLIFKTTGTGITLEELGDLCDHGAHCSFGGDYKKVASEEVVPASVELMAWMRKNINYFSCMLEKQYNYKSEKYPCGNIVAVEYDPLQASWNEGPEFPQEKVKEIHPLVKNISVQFEHGDLQSLTVTLEKKMIMQDVQRIFSLPNPFDSYGMETENKVMALTFDDYTADDKLQFSVNPVFVTSFTLTGFEHMGAGDMMAGDDLSGGQADGVMESTITYEFRETGDVYTLIDEGGPGPYEFTCTSIASVKTSSNLAAQGKSSYTADMMTDYEESTTWSEGKPGLGVGEWIEFTLTDEWKKWGYEDKDFVSKAIHGGFVIQIGYAKSPKLWKKNSRPIKFKCYFNGEEISIIQLQDTPSYQTFDVFPQGWEDVKLKEGDTFRFEIMEVIKGTSDEDACITGFHLEGSCG